MRFRVKFIQKDEKFIKITHIFFYVKLPLQCTSNTERKYFFFNLNTFKSHLDQRYMRGIVFALFVVRCFRYD